MDGGKVANEVGGVGRAEVGGVSGEGGGGAGMMAIANEEGGFAGGGVGGVVVGENDGGELQIPVILEEVDLGPEAGDDGFVSILGLAVGLGVVGGGHVELGTGDGGE